MPKRNGAGKGISRFIFEKWKYANWDEALRAERKTPEIFYNHLAIL